MDEYHRFTRDNEGALLIKKYMTLEEYERIEPFIQELLHRLFTIKVDIKPVKYLCNERTKDNGVSFEANISFPEIVLQLRQH